MTLREFVKRHRDDLNRFAADWDKAVAKHGMQPPTTHERWLAALRIWLKADNESLSERPTNPRAQRPATLSRR